MTPPPRSTLPAGLAALHGAAEQLWLGLHGTWPGLTVDVLPQVESTNTHALNLGRQGATGPCVVVAWQQTAGRGRMGRTWEAEPGQTLTFSLALPMALHRIPGGGGNLSLAVGLWVAQALEGPTPIGLKWPNDLWVADRKLGGILIEVIQVPGHAADAAWVVIGLGVNLSGTPAHLRGERCDLALLGRTMDPAQALTALTPALLQGLQRFESEGFVPFAQAHADRDVLRGRLVHQTRGTGPGQEGRAEGVHADGALRVRLGGTPDGAVVHWHSGEVSVRPVDTQAAGL